MFAATAFALVVVSGVLWWGTFRLLGIYRRIPVENYLILALAAGIGLYALIQEPSILNGAAVLVPTVLLGVAAWYLNMSAAARFPRDELWLKVGDRFPHFSLPDSHGQAFDSPSLEGLSSALYLFYRGDW